MCGGMSGVVLDKGSGESCGPGYLHGNIPTGSYTCTKDEPFARILATRAIARSPVHHTIHQRKGTYEYGEEGLKITFKNVGYRRTEGSSFPLGTGSDRYFPFRRGIRVSSSSPE
ncbi:hypothetical protein ALC60_01913 [Trachymyrmex zeteki]|uniref:Uncharacterized protein n=1 Tax=Mycetomoellerius zeteki TaxID=64791 RepID=A0A151XFN1_9HYME|nr:hypothetical protein ALC60_01913 [Trachymyrmex zeteki]